MSASGRCLQDGDEVGGGVFWEREGRGLQRSLLQVVEVRHPGSGGSGKSGSVLPRFNTQLLGGELSALRPL